MLPIFIFVSLVRFRLRRGVCVVITGHHKFGELATRSRFGHLLIAVLLAQLAASATAEPCQRNHAFFFLKGLIINFFVTIK